MRTSVSLLCASLFLAAIISTVSGRPKNCEPGETHMEDCNTCKCNNDGTSFDCSRRGCPPKPEGGKHLERHTRGRPKKCEPGETHMEDCNTCKCNNDGTSFACTRRGCPPKQEGGKHLERHTRATTKQVCVPDSSFLDEQKCNTCKCNSEGTAAACTLKLCL